MLMTMPVLMGKRYLHYRSRCSTNPLRPTYPAEEIGHLDVEKNANSWVLRAKSISASNACVVGGRPFTLISSSVSCNVGNK